MKSSLTRSILLAAIATTLYLASPAVSFASLSLTAGDNATTTPSVATSITGFQIVGPAASTTPVKLRATSGTLGLSTVSGVTMSGNNSGAVNLSGTVEKLNQALATLTYTRASTGSDTLEVSLVEPTEVFFSDNGHLYQFKSGSYTWAEARDAAAALSAYGAAGYLATISSSTENNFVYQRITGNGWIGATDIESERTWKWVTGPEAGTHFFTQSGFSGGSAVNGLYNAWYAGEPNDYNNGSPGEDCAHMYSSGGQAGTWNDFPCNSALGYVVEFGTPGNLPTVVAANISIVTADVPAVTSLSPSNGSASVAATANLVIGFSKSVSAGSGNILIKRSDDDSTFESIDVAGGQVTGGGSGSITVDPANDFDEGVTYYVIVPGTAFKDGSNNFFSGITSDSAWAFTTADATGPVISGVSAVSTASTTASITWTTNEAASTRTVYGLTPAYGRITSKSDTSPRVTSHEESLAGLLPCTLYHYQVVSDDAAGNSATSTDATFVTGGCPAPASSGSATSTSMQSSSGGTIKNTAGGQSLEVSIPEDATATSSSFVIQIKPIDNAPVLSLFGRPTAKPTEVGLVAFEVTAIIDGDTILDSFDHPVTITYAYGEADIAGLDESSLWLYHYHDGVWDALDSCAQDTANNTVTCHTDSFSVFGLFGSEAQVSGGGRTSGVTVPGRINNLLQDGNIALAYQFLLEYIKQLQAGQAGTGLFETPSVFIAGDEGSFGRDLELGMEGDDVRSLQGFLITAAMGEAAAELTRVGASGFYGRYTEDAVREYQRMVGISPQSGYFGPRTRAHVSSVLFGAR